MNDKIKKLAIQSGLGEHLWLNNSDPTEEEAVEKFAKLIIELCLKICADTIGNLEDPNNVRICCIDGLKEHFGIGIVIE